MSAKKIGPLLATFVVANNMIGSGFFLLPASLAGQGGVTALSWLLGTVIAVVLGGAFARLARDYPNLNCPDDYVRPSLGRDMGFLATTLYWASSWIGNNAIAVAAFGYLVTLLPIDGGDTTATAPDGPSAYLAPMNLPGTDLFCLMPDQPARLPKDSR